MIGSLTARIFAIFWLTLALVLMLVLMLPKLDSRQMTELLDSEQRQGLMIEQHVEAELANDPPNDLMWWRRLFRAIDKWAPPGQRLLLVTTEGRVIGAERNEMQIIRNFIGQADNADHPQKKNTVALRWSGLSPSETAKITTSCISFDLPAAHNLILSICCSTDRCCC